MNIQAELDNGKHKILKRSSDSKIEVHLSLDIGTGYETTVLEIFREGNKYLLAFPSPYNRLKTASVVLANVIE